MRFQLTIKKVNYAGASLSLQSVESDSGGNSTGLKSAESSKYSSGLRTNSERYRSSSPQSVVLINDSDNLGKRSTLKKSNTLNGSSRRGSDLVSFSTTTPAQSNMTSVLSAGGMESLYEKMRLEYAATGRSQSQLDIGDVQTVSLDAPDVAASDITTIYEDVLASNALMHRGLDPVRSSIIGSFEFIPISDEIETDNQDLLYDFTPTTCLRRRRQTDFKARALEASKQLKLKKGGNQNVKESNQNIKKSLRRLSKSAISINSSVKKQLERRK